MEWEKIVAVIGLVGTVPVFKGWIVNFFQWNKSREFNSLERQKKHYQRLKEDLQYFIGWFAESILSVLALLAAALMFKGVEIDPSGQSLANGFISMVSLLAYLVAVYRLGQYRRFKNDYDGTIREIEKRMKKFK